MLDFVVVYSEMPVVTLSSAGRVGSAAVQGGEGEKEAISSEAKAASVTLYGENREIIFIPDPLSRCPTQQPQASAL